MMKKVLIISVFMIAAVLSAAGCSQTADLVSEDYDVAQVTSESVLQIEEGMTYREIFTLLGKTQDIGYGTPTAQYLVDGEKYLNIGFDDLDNKNPYSGEEWLNYTVSAIGIRGEVTNITENQESLTILVEGVIDADTEYDKASVAIDGSTVIESADGSALEAGDISLGDTVEIVFDGAVAESDPVQGTAKIVRILTGSE